MIRTSKIIQRNSAGKKIAEKTVKKGETPSDVLLNMLLRKDLILMDGDMIYVDTDWRDE